MNLHISLQWNHNECDGVSNHRRVDCSTVCSDTEQRRHQNSTSLAFVRGIHPCPWIPSQNANNAENASTLLCHHDSIPDLCVLFIIRVERGMAAVEDNYHIVRWQVSATPIALRLLYIIHEGMLTYMDRTQNPRIRAKHMMTSSNGNIFCVAGPLCREFTGHRWIPHTKACDAEFWCFLCPTPE